MKSETPSPNHTSFEKLLVRFNTILFAFQQVAKFPLFQFCFAYILLLLVAYQVASDFAEKHNLILLILPCFAIVGFTIQNLVPAITQRNSFYTSTNSKSSFTDGNFSLNNTQELITITQELEKDTLSELDRYKLFKENLFNFPYVIHLLEKELKIVREKPNNLPKQLKNHEQAKLLSHLANSWSKLLRRYYFLTELTELGELAYITSLSLANRKDAISRACDVAWVAYSQGIIPKMETWLSNASKLEKELQDQGLSGDKTLDAKIRELQGLLLYRKLNYYDAKRCLSRALNLYQQVQDTPGCIAVLNELGDINDRWRGKNAALAYYNRALKLAENSESTRLDRGECYRKLAQLAKTDEEAKKYYAQALDIAQEFGLLDLEVSARESFLHIYENTRDYQNAYLQGREILEIFKINDRIMKRYPHLDKDYVMSFADKKLGFNSRKGK